MFIFIVDFYWDPICHSKVIDWIFSTAVNVTQLEIVFNRGREENHYLKIARCLGEWKKLRKIAAKVYPWRREMYGPTYGFRKAREERLLRSITAINQELGFQGKFYPDWASQSPNFACIWEVPVGEVFVWNEANAKLWFEVKSKVAICKVVWA